MNRIYKIVAGIIILSILFLTADIPQIVSIIASSDPLTYLGAALVFLMIYPLAAARWQILLRDQDIEISFSNSLRIITMSYGFNKILPFNSGDLARSKLHEKYHEVDSHGNIIGAVGVERSLDIMVISIVLAVTGGRYLQQMFGNPYIAFIPVLAIIASLSSLIIFERQVFWLLKYTKNYLPEKYPQFVIDVVNGIKSTGNTRVATGSVLTAFRWFVDILSLYIIAMAAGLPISLAVAGFSTAVMNIFALLPISPAGIGPVEASGTGALIISGLGYSAALSIVVLKRGLGLVLMGALGALLYIYESSSE